MCVLEGVAAADDPTPGVGGDALRGTIETDPAVTTSSALAIDGLAMRGATPAEARILVDGFEVPFLYHFGFRSIGIGVERGLVVPGGVPLERGRATAGVLELDSARGFPVDELSPFDLAVGATRRWTSTRLSLAAGGNMWVLPVPTLRDGTVGRPYHLDEGIRVDHRLDRWNLALVLLLSTEGAATSTDGSERDDRLTTSSRSFGRLSAIGSYNYPHWHGEVAASTMLYDRRFARELVQHDEDAEVAFDARAFAERKIGWVAGLREFTVKLGADLDVARHDLDVAMPAQPRENAPQVGDADPLDTSHTFHGIAWTPDGGAWGQLSGKLSPAIRANVGLRVDAFGSDLAVEPRVQLAGELSTRTLVALEGGTYRRPAEDREELEHPELSPERAAQVEAMVAHMVDPRNYVMGLVYYADRTHLIERGGDGVLRNSGRGTSLGAELRGRLARGPWTGQLSVAISHATRQDTPTSLDRPAEYDQPVRVDAIAAWHHGGWTIGARFEARSGLPYTPVQAAIYDSDRDVYEPILGRLYAERAPFHHQLDLRVDHLWRWSRRYSLDAYLDLANVYDNRSAASYVYSYDYTQKTALESLPFFPTIGLRGTL